jgi:hypothetical protein
LDLFTWFDISYLTQINLYLGGYITYRESTINITNDCSYKVLRAPEPER